MGYVGVKGIQYVAKASLYLNLIPFLMILIVFFKTSRRISNYTVPAAAAGLGFRDDDRDRHRILRDSGRGRRRLRDEQPQRRRREVGRTGRNRSAHSVCRRSAAACRWRARKDWTHRYQAGITAP